ncbi:hypothetical protein [Spirosoma jeollabukense]
MIATSRSVIAERSEPVKADKLPPAGTLKRSESAEPFPADQLGE